MRQRLTFVLLFSLLSWHCANQPTNKPTKHSSSTQMGTRLYIWQNAEQLDPYYGGQRLINAQIWYPIDIPSDTCQSAAYMSNIGSIWPSLEHWRKEDYEAVSGIAVKSCLDHPISTKKTTYPILIFSPSLGGHSSYYTFFAERLALQGFIVLGINHLYESEYVVDAQGEVYPHRTAFHDSIESLQIPDQISVDQFRALKSERIKVIGDDLIYSLDQLEKLNRTDFDNRLDLSRIGSWGHSIGGAAATYASLMDQRIRSVLNMDGTPPSIALAQGVNVPYLFLEDLTDYKNHQGYKKQFDRRSAFCSKSQADAYRVLIDGIQHNSFIDFNYYLASNANERAEEQKQLDVFLQYMVPFFQHTLQDQPLSWQPTSTDSLEVFVF